jgi:hypothetical protein
MVFNLEVYQIKPQQLYSTEHRCRNNLLLCNILLFVAEKYSENLECYKL